jgi:hypothetical protein
VKANVGTTTRLTRRGRVLLTVFAFVAAAGIGFCDPLWQAVPWAVTP